MPPQVDTARRISELSSKILASPRSELLLGCIQSQFTWIKFGELVWARTLHFRSALFWAVRGAEPVHLNGDDALRALSNLLLVQVGPLPDGLTPVELAGAVRQLTVEPRACVASQEFLAENAPELGEWLKKDAKPERELFARQCSDPQLVKSTEDDTWSLTFNAFNPEGGVESWRVAGDKAQVLSATKSVAVRDGTFIWPWA